MLDVKDIRNNPDTFTAMMKKRGKNVLADQIVQLDEDHREKLTKAQELQSERNTIAKQFGQLKAKGEDTAELSKKAEQVKTNAAMYESEADVLSESLRDILSGLPNYPADDVPEGENEDDNVLVREVGKPREISGAKQHFELGESLEQMDFERAAKLSGSRFVFLYKDLARLERALAAFMLDTHTKQFGYEEVYTPLLVHDKAMFGTGQLPKFREDQFRTENGHWLIPTAEVVLTNLVAEEILAEEELPLRYTTYTPCFRLEAGSAGRDTRGMIRMHQFGKVELVSVTTPEQSLDEHERMVSAAEEILKRLDLPYRVMLLCAQDMGFSARKTYDLEVWLPGQQAYREISSCSNCWEFQARRMHARYRAAGEKKPQLVHTLNGSGLATGRALVAVLENYQQADGSIVVPDVLKPYMGGVEIIQKA